MARGLHEKDKKYFGPQWVPILRKAVTDLSWLWSENYGERSSLELVGNRYQLTTRQRLALKRCKALIHSNQVVTTSDSQVLNRVSKWYNLTARVIDKKLPKAWIIDLSNSSSSQKKT
ncbi:MAG: DUF434 domain-containing protein [Bdellovibrio sp.]|nr:DUF434 domain-containing protein [Bdellovibrio sp.]